MPIYEYSCRKCDARVEAMQKLSDKPLSRHAGCGGRLEKEWSRTGFQFKGSGWYVTDYAGKKSSDAKESGETKDSADTKDSKDKTSDGATQKADGASKDGGDSKTKPDAEKKPKVSTATKTKSSGD